QAFGVANVATPVNGVDDAKKFLQEIRLSAPIGQRVDWLLGAFYTHEKSSTVNTWTAVDPATKATVGLWYNAFSPTTYTEYAAFTDLTFKLTDQFDVQIGGRESEIQTGYSSYQNGYIVAVPTSILGLGANTSAFTYLLTPRFKVSQDLMLYA